MIKFYQSILSSTPKINISNKDVLLVFDGDSLTRGFNNAGIEQYYPLEVKSILEPKVGTLEFYSYGVGGQSTLQMLNDVNSQIYPKVDINKTNILIAWEDVNAILNDGRTAQQNFNDFETYFSGAKSAGYDYCILLTSYYPRLPVNQPQWGDRISEQEAYFDLVKNTPLNTVSWDAVIDLRNAEIIGGEKDQSVDGIYFEDSVHLNQIGYDIIVGVVVDKLKEKYIF